jgi:hypothetical protein
MFLILWLRFSSLPASPMMTQDMTPLGFALWWMSGGPSQGLLFTFGPAALAKRFAMFAGYSLYQFPSPALLLAPLGLYALWKRKRLAWIWMLCGVFFVNLAYALNFDSSDVYVFYVPCHVAVAAMAGFGAAWLARRYPRNFRNKRRGRRSWTALVGACLLLPPVAYFATPKALNAAGLVLSQNKGNRYYLWPPKRGELTLWNAQAEALAKTLPDGSALLLNWNTIHLMGGYLDRAERTNKIQLLNLPREGIPLADGNWAATVQRSLMANPGGRIWALGEVPGLRGDPLYRVWDFAGVRVYELSALAPNQAFYDEFRADFEAALREALKKRGALGANGALVYRPFYDSAGEIQALKKSGQ